MFLHKSVKFTFQEDFRTRLLIIQVTIQLDIYFNLKCFIIAMNWLITTQWMSISQMTDICLYSRYLFVQSIYVCTVDICLYSRYLFVQSIYVCTVNICLYSRYLFVQSISVCTVDICLYSRNLCPSVPFYPIY